MYSSDLLKIICTLYTRNSDSKHDTESLLWNSSQNWKKKKIKILTSVATFLPAQKSIAILTRNLWQFVSNHVCSDSSVHILFF